MITISTHISNAQADRKIYIKKKKNPNKSTWISLAGQINTPRLFKFISKEETHLGKQKSLSIFPLAIYLVFTQVITVAKAAAWV